MLLDLEHGRPMEIDPIVTVVQEIGRRLKIPTPTIDVVAALINLRQAMALGQAGPTND
jgi:2-dehydropantoate 2-reductase